MPRREETRREEAREAREGTAPARPPGAQLAPAPSKEWSPLPAAATADLTPRDMLTFVAAAVDENGLVGHNLRGADSLLREGLNEIMERLFRIDRTVRNDRAATEGDRARTSFRIQIEYHGVRVDRPRCTMYDTGQIAALFPARARAARLPYSGAMTVGATVTLTANYADGRAETRAVEIDPFQIGTFPIMVGSVGCHTHGATREALKAMGEDPLDPRGNYLPTGGDQVVENSENIRYNAEHVHVAMKPAEYVRVEFLSQPGGAFQNSSQVIVRYMRSGAITCEINSTKFEKVRIPFYLIYRLFGMTSDREVVSTIVLEEGALAASGSEAAAPGAGPSARAMLEALEKAFHVPDADFGHLAYELDRERLVRGVAERLARFLTNPTAYASNESAVQFLNQDLLGNSEHPGGLDRIFLPHMGEGSESRVRKLRFFGLLVHKALLAHQGVLPPTDRDSYRHKRLHGADLSLAKAFKTQVNDCVVSRMIQALRRLLKTDEWEKVTAGSVVAAVRGAIAPADLNRAMEQALTAGAKTIVTNRTAKRNRVTSTALERKNMLNVLCALRSVVTPNGGGASKQTDRADQMRRVHASMPGFICIAHSPDTGEGVGMRKQLALTATVFAAGDAAPLRRRLLADPDVTPLDAPGGGQGARVFVNGEWIGTCRDEHALVARWRALRREGVAVDPTTSICVDSVTGEVGFWLDVGRLGRPLLIVDNNLLEYAAARRAARARAALAAPGAAGRGKVSNWPGGYREGADSVVRDDGATYLVDLLLAVVAGHPATAVSLANLEAGGRADLDPVRVSKADLSAPVLVRRAAGAPAGSPDYVVLDGAHRVARARAEGRATLPARFLTAAELRHCAPEAAPPVKFAQNVRFTRAHARALAARRLGLGDLVREGVAEYVTPEEAENCLIAPSVAALRAAAADVTRRYTHCEVEQALFGLAAHLSPFGNHTQPARVTYETNQARQTGGWYAMNFPFRADKNRFFQFFIETPLVYTISSRFVLPAGANATVALISYGGDNQEDSAIVNRAAVDRGLFAGAFFRYEMAELEKGDAFGTPDPATTRGLVPRANYERLVDGFVPPGAVVRDGDVLIGRYARLAAADREGGFLYTDRSVVYRGRETAVVEEVLRPRGANDELFAVVKLRFERPLRVGDKISNRSGNKGIIARVMPAADMPFDEDGASPDILMNPHSLPTRMTVGQLIETSTALVCARRGVVADGTAFLPVDHDDVAAQLVAAGLRANGRRRLFNGFSGECLDAAVYCGPMFVQRLQKFVYDEEQCIGGSGPTDATTGQPLSGKHAGGGLRKGEMEKHTDIAHGAALNLYEKFFTDSDGRVQHVCRGCGAYGVYNPHAARYECKNCGELANLAAVDSSKSAHLFHEELAASNVRLTFGLEPFAYEARGCAPGFAPGSAPAFAPGPAPLAALAADFPAAE